MYFVFVHNVQMLCCTIKKSQISHTSCKSQPEILNTEVYSEQLYIVLRCFTGLQHIFSRLYNTYRNRISESSSEKLELYNVLVYQLTHTSIWKKCKQIKFDLTGF